MHVVPPHRFAQDLLEGFEPRFVPAFDPTDVVAVNVDVDDQVAFDQDEVNAQVRGTLDVAQTEGADELLEDSEGGRGICTHFISRGRSGGKVVSEGSETRGRGGTPRPHDTQKKCFRQGYQ